jgi:flagellar export protein FliJ
MPFRFPLEAILHLRRSLEHQQESRLHAANQQVARVRHLIDGVDHRLQEMRVQAAQQLSEGVTAAEIRFSLLSEIALGHQRLVLQQELLRVQALRDEQQKIYQKVRRERETFEIVREDQLREYQREAARREQRQLDDSFLLRETYLRLASRKTPQHGQTLPG